MLARTGRRRKKGISMIREDPKIEAGVEIEREVVMKSEETRPLKEAVIVIGAETRKTGEIGVEAEVEIVAGERGRAEMRGTGTRTIEVAKDIKIIL